MNGKTPLGGVKQVKYSKFFINWKDKNEVRCHDKS